MKRLGVLWIILVLASCAPKEEQIEQIEQKKEHYVHTLPSETFHFVAGFLEEDEILYVVKTGELFELQTFHLQTGAVRTIWETKDAVVDVLLHPIESVLYVQTANSQYMGTLHILQADGQVLRTIDFEGSEIHIALNKEDAQTFAYTVFADDWSFETFIYDGQQRYTRWIDASPFPFPFYWNGSLYGLVEANHPLEGSSLGRFDEATETVQIEKEGSFIAAFPAGKEIATIAIDSETFIYELKGKTYEVPAVSNYGAWVVPPYTWTADDRFLTLEAEKRAELDELLNGWNLISLKDGERVILEEKRAMQYELKCSPSGLRCLTGERYEEISQEGEQLPWLTIK